LVGGDRNGEVVPAVVAVEQAIVVVLETARKKNEQPSADARREGINYVLDLGQAKHGTHTAHRDHGVAVDADLLDEGRKSTFQKFQILGQQGAQQLRLLEVFLRVALRTQPLRERIGQ